MERQGNPYRALRIEMETDLPSNPPSFHQGAEIVDNEIIHRFPLTRIVVAEENGPAVSSESPEGMNPVENDTERVHTDFSRLRQTTDENEQNLFSYIPPILLSSGEGFTTTIFPFLVVFLLKGVVNYYKDLGILLASDYYFIKLDTDIKLWVMGGTLTWQQKLNIPIHLITGLFITSAIDVTSVENFSIIKCFSLRYAGDTILGFQATILVVLQLDYFVKFSTCTLKIFLFVLPCISVYQKRRLLQCTEYISQMFRCLLPAPQWFFYFIGPITSPDLSNLADYCLVFIYSGLKARELFFIGIVLVDSCRNIFQDSNYLSNPTQNELEEAQMCSICHDNPTNPIKLLCTHIFCQECINTWLYKNHICPMCRAVVKKTNNQWKTGGTSSLMRFY